MGRRRSAPSEFFRVLVTELFIISLMMVIVVAIAEYLARGFVTSTVPFSFFLWVTIWSGAVALVAVRHSISGRRVSPPNKLASGVVIAFGIGTVAFVLTQVTITPWTIAGSVMTGLTIIASALAIESQSGDQSSEHNQPRRMTR